MRHTLTLAGCLLALLALPGCDSGGAPPSAGADYVPLGIGDRWVYTATLENATGTVAGDDELVLVTGTREQDGERLLVRDSMLPGAAAAHTRDLLHLSDNGLSFRFGAGFVLFGQPIETLDLLRFPLVTGDSFIAHQWRNVASPEDADGDGLPESLDIVVAVSVAGFEDVETPAGDFRNAVKVVTEWRQAVTYSRDNERVELRTRITDWYARHVGPVKRVNLQTSPFGPPESTTHVLQSYVVNGRRSETRPPVAVTSTPHASQSNHAWPDIRAGFDEYLDPDVAGDLTFTLRRGNGAAVPVYVVFRNGRDLQFVLREPLESGSYTASLQGVRDFLGNELPVHEWFITVDRSPPVDPQDLFPLREGDRWIYNVSTTSADTPPQNSRLVERVGELVNTAAGPAHAYRYIDPDTGEPLEEFFLAKTDTGIYQDVPSPDGAEPPRLLLRLPLKDGDDYRTRGESGLDIGKDYDGDGINETYDWYVSVSVARTFEWYLVDGQRYDNLYRVVTRYVQQFHGSQAGSLEPEILRETTEWIAPGVGVIRRKVVDSRPENESTTISALTRYAVGNRRSETVVPQVSSWSVSNQTLFALPDGISATFSEPLDRSGITPANVVLREAGGATVAGSITVDNQTLRFTPTEALPPGQYTLTITGIPDELGNRSATAQTSFTLDSPYPRVISTSPAPGAREVRSDSEIAIQFSKAMGSAGLKNRNVVLMAVDPPAAERTFFTGRVETSRYVIAPLARLDDNTTYEVTVGTAAADLGGMPLQAPYTFRFTTRAALLQPEARYGLSAQVEAAAIGDVTGDARNDLVVVTSVPGSTAGSNRNTLHLYAQTASGTLAVAQTWVTADTAECAPSSVAIGDVTGDGRNDIVVGESGCGLKIYQRDADGSWPPAERLAGSDTYRLRIADLNGDARLDIAGIGRVTGTVSLWYQRAAGGLAAPVSQAAQRGVAYDLVPGDINGDALTDIAIAAAGGSPAGAITLLRQIAGGGFSAAEYIGTGVPTAEPLDIAIGDVTGDGRNDVVVGRSNGSDVFQVSVLRQLPGGSLSTATHAVTTGRPAGIAIADLNGDGRADVVVAHSDADRLSVHRQTAAGILETGEALTASTYMTTPQALAIGDLNSDGHPDVVTGSNGSFSIRRGTPPPP